MTAALAATAVSKRVILPSGELLRLVDQVDLEVMPGTSLAVMGRSGSGKSTLLALCGLLSAPDEGQIAIGGIDTCHLADREKARLRNSHIGFVFQGYSLVPHMTAAENVELPLLQGGRMGRRERLGLVRAAMDLVGIGHRASSSPRQLSGGEQQRTAIARALVRSPALIVADEPTGALDTDTADTVLGVLTQAALERGAALILATHDVQVACRADQILHLRAGRLDDLGQAA